MNQFTQYIQLIGKGRSSGQYLNREQARDAMSLILSNKVQPEQLGAFLMLLRVREESAEELTGFVEACRRYSQLAKNNLNVDIDLACYAGKRRQLPWFLLSTACLVSFGKTVFIHGTSEHSSERLYIDKVLPKLGLQPCRSQDEIYPSLNLKGVAYSDVSLFNPQLNYLLEMRETLGLRSCANTLARLLNPSRAKYVIQGVHHRHVDEKHAAINAYFHGQSSLCFRGDGGEAEVNPTHPTTLHFSAKGISHEYPFLDNEKGWGMKDNMADVSPLIALWNGEKHHEYGLKAVLSTLTAYLMLINQQNEEKASICARQIWASRDKSSLPFMIKDSINTIDTACA